MSEEYGELNVLKDSGASCFTLYTLQRVGYQIWLTLGYQGFQPRRDQDFVFVPPPATRISPYLAKVSSVTNASYISSVAEP